MGTTATKATDLTIRPLTGCIGAEVRGVQIGNLTDDQFDKLREAFLKYCVVVIRDQFLDDPALQIEFTRRWGEPYIIPIGDNLPGFEEIRPVVNVGKKKTVTEQWHADATFLEEPPAHAILAAQVLPEAGGDTMFSNQYAAYESLSPGMRAFLDERRAWHKDTVLAAYYGTEPGNEVINLHPAVRTHPDTKRKCLYVNPLFTTHFEDMTEEESGGLLDFLTTHAVRPDFVYRHRWLPGDVVMWDNRCTMHYAVHDHGDAERVMHRTTVAGGRPA